MIAETDCIACLRLPIPKNPVQHSLKNSMMPNPQMSCSPIQDLVEQNSLNYTHSTLRTS